MDTALKNQFKLSSQMSFSNMTAAIKSPLINNHMSLSLSQFQEEVPGENCCLCWCAAHHPIRPQNRSQERGENRGSGTGKCAQGKTGQCETLTL